jgi:hypothetical protein
MFGKIALDLSGTKQVLCQYCGIRFIVAITSIKTTRYDRSAGRKKWRYMSSDCRTNRTQRPGDSDKALKIKGCIPVGKCRQLRHLTTNRDKPCLPRANGSLC